MDFANLTLEQLQQLIAAKQQQELQEKFAAVATAAAEASTAYIATLVDPTNVPAILAAWNDLQSKHTEMVTLVKGPVKQTEPVAANTAAPTTTTSARGRKASAPQNEDPYAAIQDATGLDSDTVLDIVGECEDALPKHKHKSDDCRYMMRLLHEQGCNMQEVIAGGKAYLVGLRGFGAGLAATYCSNNYSKAVV